MAGVKKNLGGWPIFQDFAVAHYSDGIAHLRCDPQIMRYEEHRQLKAFLDNGSAGRRKGQ